MPIVVRAVPEKEFEAWVTEAKTKFSDAAPGPAPGPLTPGTEQIAAVEVRH
jgi:heme/copper-type cytochrome/quinol oxidase subunit 2